jgi:hypothetical protein
VNVIKSIQGFINGVHNTWLALPEWFRKGLRGAVLGGIVAVSALNLAIPGSLSEAKAEGLTAFTVFVTTAWPILRIVLVPHLAELWLTASGSARAVKLTTLTPAESDKWTKVA